ncbi:conserved hypothetical protein [Cupriavidus taiwanensis]|uniref:CopG-like ribbon-helix-helix domain-containing protein n=1 Tax=Cupriavidus taiwanensis TaxID=164546 RepID=A0A976B2X2_9BURK|nr:conserved hypothetical protein [Cupriavidus taiwanensis]SOZ69758.1 conserved hypothetical protein [Cupriavidus taiwanensis]SOZ72944.1 conserved hypothetical protein [Cupriavidus taiwanensis]SPA09853.1 conserved hypothetical protein [Cupriavidus taiwanensis]SPA23809.1 conserved hypothetical protein [Cupriavidus taiwanensis]
MSSPKSVGISFRVTPSFKNLLERAAAYEKRSLTNMLEVALEEYCERNGILVDSQPSATDGRP